MNFELWRYRGYIWNNAIMDLRNRYAGSSFGVLWNVLQPLFQILIFTFVFSQIMVARIPGLESTSAFAIYLCAGLIPWGIFSETVIRGSNSFLENASFLKKLPVPEYVFICQSVVASTIVLFVSVSILLIVVTFLGGAVSVTWLLLPLMLLLFQAFAFGLALLFGCINVFFRDIGQILGTAMQIWMWMTPIVYFKDILPEGFQQAVDINPVYWYISSLHEIIVYSKVPDLQLWTSMVICSLVSIILGALVLRALRAEIRDVI
ncbi:ABC transporter permease [Paenibacillus antri]|uniref:Transport permease protein n=1 Tax=Paenibacillus antri TaxID=2582848 RepID=A0A5R9GK37_9BACL|nr:ABC transporter permease [Paenibacillus antri]TLS52015.1 ABC transporter permease [Paenibacillus antri]